MRTNDLVSGLIIIITAVVMLLLTLSFPPFPGQKYGPSLFPRLLGAAMILCGGLLILRHVRATTTKPAFALDGWMREPWRLVSFLLVLVVPILSILLWDRIGFVPVAFISLLGLFLWFRTRPATALLAALTATVLLQMFFGKLMRVPLPPGWLLNLPPHWLKYIL